MQLISLVHEYDYILQFHRLNSFKKQEEKDNLKKN